MWPLKTILCFVLLWWGWLGALVNPIWGVVTYLFVYQVNPTSRWWGEPIATLGIRISLFAALFTLIGMVVARKQVPRHRPTWCAWEWGVLLLLGLGTANILLGVKYDAWSALVFDKFWKTMAFVLVLGRLATTRRNLRLVLWSLVIGSLYLGHDAYNAPRWDFVEGRLNAGGGPDFRSASGLAAYMSAMLPLIGAMYLSATQWKWRVLALLAGAFSVNTIVLCRTRAAFVGLLLGSLVAVVCAPRVGRFRIYFVTALAALCAYGLTDNLFWARMSTLRDRQTLTESDHATRTRVDIWKLSTRILADHPLGIGVGNFPHVVGRYDPRYHLRASHNTVVLCFVEMGVQGGTLMFLLIGGALVYLRKCQRLAPLTDQPLETAFLTYGLLVSLTTYFVTGLGTERLYCESYWWVMALPLCLYRVVSREVQERSANAAIPPQDETKARRTGGHRHQPTGEPDADEESAADCPSYSYA
ncbi:MAG TPA: O-antigen ligase family protein [Phycisphaerae bacterium]|nr:O-antigen ligase family protein [Phycisphaerae bacterium]HNU44393.1 O-antigen ligase family protein [Phycisphaerae bacterium]